MPSDSKQPSDKAEESSNQNQQPAQTVETKQQSEFHHLEDENGLWTMDFDGALGKYGVGIGIWIHNPLHQPSNFPKNVVLHS